MPEKYAIYLRKSRADVEAEARGEGETLARHEKTLLDLAQRQHYGIDEIYREIVSGENIAARPQMQRLLSDVNDGKYDGVLVMEIERLARGDTIDQGVVAQAFKSSDTKIITPLKSYDPDNEFDEEYFEFGLFMSRREYKTIKRRMNAGRLAAVRDGNYISTNPPYGYRKVSPEPKIHTLEVVPDEAEIIRYIYQAYLDGRGSRVIAAELNALGSRPVKSEQWNYVSIKKILRNPVYAGKLTWKTKSAEDAIFDGRHEAIIPYDEYLAVQHKRESSPLAKVKTDYTLKYHYTGLLYCAHCGRAMIRRDIPDKHYEHVLCRSPECRGIVVSSRINVVDELLMGFMRSYLAELKEKVRNGKTGSKPADNRKKILQSELTKLTNQQARLCDYLEQGIYDTATYVSRAKILTEKIEDCKRRQIELNTQCEEHLPPREMITRIRHVLNCFEGAKDAAERNDLLKSVVRKITYNKTERMCNMKTDSDIELHVDFL